MVTAITRADYYVTAYDIRGTTTAYTVLAKKQSHKRFTGPMIEVGRRSLEDLLYGDAPATEDLDQSYLVRLASFLHVQKARKERISEFAMEGKQLALFVPTLAISPDEKSLITVAS